MTKKASLFLLIIPLIFFSCGNKQKTLLVQNLVNYNQEIDSFSLLLNTFNDPNPDSLIVRLKSIETEFSGIITEYNDILEKQIDNLKTRPKEKKNLKKRFIGLQMKANMLLQKILYNKEKAMVNRLEIAKNNLNVAVADFNKFGNEIGNAISNMNKSQLAELDQTIVDVKTTIRIKIDSLNRQYSELRLLKNK